MKPASAATITNLGSGSPLIVHLYQFTLAGGTLSYYFTDHQIPVVVGGIVYGNGLVVERPQLKYKRGLEVQTADFTFIPQTDGGKQIVIGSQTFLKAVGNRVLDNARMLYSRMYLTNFADFSPGTVPIWQGRVNEVKVDRLKAVLSVNCDIEMLNVSMPLNLVQTPCSHTLFDTGCTLKANNPLFFVNAAVVAGSDVLNIKFAGSQVADYFTLGKVIFNSGANQSSPNVAYFIKKHTQLGGVNTLQLIRPVPNAPTIGDSMTVTVGCPKTWNACKNTSTAVGPPFNNSSNFDGMPFVPVPETMYDGGTPQIYNANTGGQSGVPAGSPFGSGTGPRGAYKP